MQWQYCKLRNENREHLVNLMIKYLIILVKLAEQCKATRLDFVADRYPAISIKNSESSKRAAQGVQRAHILSKDQNIPKQWKNT